MEQRFEGEAATEDYAESYTRVSDSVSVVDIYAESKAHLERLAQLYLELEAACATSRELVKMSKSLVNSGK